MQKLNATYPSSSRLVLLLDGYLSLQTNDQLDRIRRWTDVQTGWRQRISESHVHSEQLYETLLDGYERSIAELRKLQVNTAEDFNLFETLDIEGDELRHSGILAWLANNRSTHAQGTLGLKLLLTALRLPDHYANKKYWVRLEAEGEESRIDVEIASRNEFLIHIENKIWAKAGDKQIEREAKDAERRAEELGVADENIHCFFLALRVTPGPLPKSFRAISWTEIAAVFEEFAKQSKAPPIQWFASHYSKALKQLIAQARKSEDEDENEI